MRVMTNKAKQQCNILSSLRSSALLRWRFYYCLAFLLLTSPDFKNTILVFCNATWQHLLSLPLY